MQANLRLEIHEGSGGYLAVNIGDIRLAEAKREIFSHVQWDLLSDFIAEDITENVFLRSWKEANK